MLRKIRIILALAVITATVLLFCDFTGTMIKWAGWIPKIQLVPALLACHALIVVGIIIATLIFGRIYCSVICPLGIFQDGINRLRSIFGGKKARNRFKYRKPLTWLRLAMLLLFVILIVSGFTAIAALIEPYSEFGRMVMTFIAPAYEAGNNALASAAESADSYAFYEFSRHAVTLPAILISATTFIIVATMAWAGGRLYCNSICPVGTLLGFFSRFSLLRPVIDTSKCNGCKKCARNCKAHCIDAENHAIDMSRCVVCMDCINTCSQGAISYTLRPPKVKKENSPAEEKINPDRRKFLAMTSALAAAAAVKGASKSKLPTDTATSTTNNDLVPAGALSLRHLQQHCTACQLCISECPNGVLRPSMDIDSFMQPKMGYENGYCRPECVACSNACPAGAIRPISVEEKSSIRIGRAFVDKTTCYSATGKFPCGNCERHCPSGAISMVTHTTADGLETLLPVVNEAKCIGCGACEHLCPVNPVSAITVRGYDTHTII